MIPVGKAMAEALLESDESTASLSEGSLDMDYFDDTQLIPPAKYPNANTNASVLVPSPRCNPLSDIRTIRQSEIRRPHIPHLPLTSIHGNHSSFSECRYVALDCESKFVIAHRSRLKPCALTFWPVVGVGPGGKRSVLARVSIVDYFGQCLFDRFVKVEERVTDYRYHVTGISPLDLTSSHALPFGVCRQQVISIIRNKVLVGHGLKNDLAILGIHHPWFAIRDTSTYYPYQKQDRNGRNCPSRLCHLAKNHLGIEIQKDGQPHCPIEDACAAMALYRKNQLAWDNFMDRQHHRTMPTYP